jgi:HK97 family phage portal protein
LARFLPALRGKAHPMQSATDALGPMTPQTKALVGQYLSSLVQSQYGYGRRPKRWDVERAVQEGYERIVWVFKAVDVIASNASALPFRLLDDAQNEIADHGLLDLLNGPRANPLETGREFRERLSAQILLSYRGAFVEMTLSRRNTPTRVDLLPPSRTEIIPGDGDDPIKCYRVTLVDGTKRYLEPEQVLWFRKPHPTDPYRGMTPLEAAGLAVELDFFADLYNANFMRNDGRPGGILAVKNSATGQSMSDKEMDRVEARFGKGPIEAGKMSVISGDVSFVDPAAKPRDTHYADLSDRAKVKVLTAFGLDESIVGDTSGRTFANSEQAWENFWLLDPMPAHLRLLSNGWGRVPGLDGLTPDHDTTEVEPLRRARAAKLEDARAEVAAGLRTIKSYATLAGYGDEVADTPHTHALWIANALIPIATREEDIHVLDDQNPKPGQTAAATGQAAGPAAAPGPQALPAAGQPAALGAAPAPAAFPAPRHAGTIVQDATAMKTGRPELEYKASPRVTRPRPRLAATPVAPAHSSEADDETSRAAEGALAAALAAVAERFVERTVARLQSPKSRKGTKHWQPEYEHDTRIGTKALDTTKIVDEDAWASEAATVASPYVQAAATASSMGVASDVDPGLEHPVVDAAVTIVAVDAALSLVRDSARRQARRLADILNLADQAGQAMADLVTLARGFGDRLHSWARGLATQVTVAAIEGSRQDTVRALIDRGVIDASQVRRTWITMMDERVRPTHERAQGQTVPLGKPFVVGSALLRFPGDPLAPASETANCRCKTLITFGVRRATVTIGTAA